MENNKVKVKGQEMDQAQFKQMQETIQNDPTKKLKQISENEYTVLDRMNG